MTLETIAPLSDHPIVSLLRPASGMIDTTTALRTPRRRSKLT
jgi:hypothetical protein